MRQTNFMEHVKQLVRTEVDAGIHRLIYGTTTKPATQVKYRRRRYRRRRRKAKAE